jgi:Rad3-related DNA helicase
MTFDLDQRTVALSVGEFADFTLGPREGGSGGAAGLWRAQLGTHWHHELRTRAVAEHAAAASFEIPITGRIVHRGWVFTLTGRIDQLIRQGHAALLREIKSVTTALPADESALRTDYPTYFLQLATYAALSRLGLATTPLTTTTPASATPASTPPSSASAPPAECHLLSDNVRPPHLEECHLLSDILRGPARAELVFVEAASGLVQTVPLTPADDALFRTQLERVAEFLDLRLRARQRLRGLRFRPAFATPRPGQATTRAELTALFHRQPLVFFEAPTGFGKTGVLLEFALDQLRSGHFDRALYLTSKSTGQLQVVRTLAAMTSPTAPPDISHPLDDKTASTSLGTCHPLDDKTASHSLETCHPLDDKPAKTAGFGAGAGGVAAGTPVAAWHVRNKGEHCINPTFHCVREACSHLAGAAERWPQSGLARFYLDEHHARDLDALRAAGRDARICPYEITRAALAFNDVWIGDYNYVFAPRNRGLFYEQPGFVAARTLLLLDEAHNLPARVADAHSHAFTAATAYAVRDELHRVRPAASLVAAWEHWCHFLHHLRANNGLAPAEEDDARHLLEVFAQRLASTSLDFATLGPAATDALWQVPALVAELSTLNPQLSAALPRLWWSPRDGELALTCLDAAPAIGATLREFGGVVLASATLNPIDGFAAACGLDRAFAGESPNPSRLGEPAAPALPTTERLGALNKRDTRTLFRQLTSAAELLRVEEARDAASPALLRAQAPWRDHSYDLAFDARVDTTFQHRSHHYTTTAATVAALHAAACAPRPSPSSLAAVAVFFPSYAYAEAILKEVATVAPELRVALQPRLRDLAAQSAWVDESLRRADALFLVLGSSFAESIDALGGRISHAMVVGPALPEVNAVQRARLAEATRAGLSREAAFRRVYQIPGMTKVNQALGRLVRAPGQRARVVLHCRRFLDTGYTSLLAPEYQLGAQVRDDDAFAAWLQAPPRPAATT